MTHHLDTQGAYGPTFTLFTILIATLALGILATMALVRAHRRRVLAAREAASVDADRPLVEGDAVISGVVEYAPGRDVAVRVDITQHGFENESSGSWSTTWKEVDRATVVAPFFLRLRDGTRVLVEPPRTVDVADELDRKVRVSETERIRTAELVPGEVIHARGRLARGGPAAPADATGYRDVTWGWVLQPAQGQMLLSATPLGDGLRQRARFHRTTGWWALAALIALHVSLIGYYVRTTGRVTYVPVETTSADPARDSDGNRYTRYTVTVTLPGAGRTRFEVDDDEYDNLADGDQIAIWTSSRGATLGDGPGLDVTHALLIWVGWIVLCVRYRVRRKRTRPWFRGTVVDSGPGRLSESRTS